MAKTKKTTSNNILHAHFHYSIIPFAVANGITFFFVIFTCI